MGSKRTGCLVCGAEIVYLADSEEMSCAFCGARGASAARCATGHYVCDACHAGSAKDVIERVCLAATGRDPVALAIQLMRHPAIKMHGPEHHYLVPAVLLAAYASARGDGEPRARWLAEARRRSDAVLGGFCGLHGACGAGVGTGIFVSLVTGATPLAREPWRHANAVTARSLAVIADSGGPRCCKRDTFLAILEAARFSAERLGVALDTPERVRCDFHGLNRECLKEECAFFPG